MQHDPDLFFASSHQYGDDFYPGTGSPDETGMHNNVLNCGLADGSGSTEFRQAWAGEIIPALRAFRPELILVSAGFDAHSDDPVGELELADDDYLWVQTQLMCVAREVCDGKLVSVLEGGYDLRANARSAVQCVVAQTNH